MKRCPECQQNQKSPPEVPLHPWVWPQSPWVCLLIDYAGPFLVLVVIDADSKWLGVGNASSHIQEHYSEAPLHLCLPEVLVLDNGTAFTSSEFQEFTKKNSIKHIMVSTILPRF